MESPPSFFEVLGYSAEFHYVTTTGKFYNFNQILASVLLLSRATYFPNKEMLLCWDTTH